MTSSKNSTVLSLRPVSLIARITRDQHLSKACSHLIGLALSIAFIPGYCQTTSLGASLEPAAGLSRASESLLQLSQSDQQGNAFPELSQLIQRAFMQSPVPLKTERNVAAGQARIEEANAAFLPKLSTSLGAGRTDYGANASSSGQGDRSITASQLVYDFGLSPSLRDAASERMQASMQSARSEQSKLALAMLQAVLDWQRAAQSLELAKSFVKTRQQFLDLTHARAKEGMNSPFDVQRAQAKLLEAQDEVPPSERRLQGAATRLGELFGKSFNPSALPARFQLPAALPSPQPSANTPTIESLSSFREMRAIANALTHELNAEQSRLWGAINAEASHSLSDVGSSFERKRSSAVLVFRSELLSGFAQRARIRQAAARLGESEYELERLQRELQARIDAARQEWEASERIQSTRRNLLEEMQKAELSTRELFLFARASLTDVFRAQEDFMNAAQKLLQVSFDRQLAWYQWAYHQDQLLDTLSIRSP
jgi:adhesin transport system outer membrane protein